MKYTIKDLINKKIIVSCNYEQAKMLAEELKKENIDTSTIDLLMSEVDQHDFSISVENGKVVGNTGDVAIFDEELYIGFNQLDIFENKSLDEKERKSFKLKEIVHVIENIQKREPFNIFAGTEHYTAYISAIDEKNKMCEVVNLKDNDKSIWLTFDEIFHIKHTYEYYFEEEGDSND